MMKLADTDPTVAPTGGRGEGGWVREDRAELAAENDVYELDALPQRWDDEDIESKGWMKNQMVGVDIYMGSPRNQELNRV